MVVDRDDDAAEETVGGLDANKWHAVRFDDVRLRKGQHMLTATADPKGPVAEADEGNNERKDTA